jgi:hypothetical protein
MELSDMSKVCIRLVLYCILYSPDPSDAKVIEHNIYLIQRGDDPFTVAEYTAAIREALDSETQLSLLLPQPHSEDVIRSFLSKLLDRLTAAEQQDL